jgi:cation diffusion facilitator CzcD-associated flavoprotein CzcO
LGHGEARSVEVLILGAGVSGIAAGVGLRRAGIEDFVIIDRAAALAGTWHHNRYPGCAVDVPTHVYSFSFAPNPEWSRFFGEAREVEGYLNSVARDHGLHEKVLLETELHEAAWSEDDQRWHIQTTAGEFRARAFVIAPGPLHEAVTPNLPGLERFEGQSFHSSRWPADADLEGRDVVAIGTGASAIQFLPAIQPEVRSLTVLQRTPSWVMPKPDWRIRGWEKRMLRRFPFLTRLVRWGTWAAIDAGVVVLTRHPRIARLSSLMSRVHMRRSISDPEVRRALTPDYAPTCKRIGLSNDYFRTFAQPNVELVTSAAAEVRTGSVVTTDGREIPCDTIIYGTGFHTLPHHPINGRVRGKDGRTLAEVWNGCPTAYLGTTIAGFPNAFFMFGPNIGTVSGFVMAEAQTDYLVGAVKVLQREGVSSLDVRREALESFVSECDAVLENTTFVKGGCTSYYLDERGRAALVWPWTMARMRRRLKRFDESAYEVRRGAPAPAPATVA